MITINFPVKPHVKKYLEFKFGQTYTVSKTDYLGNTILEMLSNKYVYLKSNKGQTETYQIAIPQKYVYEQGYYFTPEMYNQFNKRMDQLFFEDLYSQYKLNVNIPKNEILTRFLDVLNIWDNEYSFESILKRLNRRIKDEKDKKKKF